MAEKIIIKVKPNEGEAEKDYMDRCVPAMVEEGKAQDQAVAMCSAMFGADKKLKEEEVREKKRVEKEKEWQEKFDKPFKKGCKTDGEGKEKEGKGKK